MEGYSKLATLMASYPDTAIIRRFAALNMQKILYLQAELTYLEDELREIEKSDKNSSDPNKKDASLDFIALSHYSTYASGFAGGDAKDSRPCQCHCVCPRTTRPPDLRWALMQHISQKLKDYSK